MMMKDMSSNNRIRKNVRWVSFALLAAGLSTVVESANAAFIRPFGALGAEIEDGLVQAIPPNQLNPTIKTAQFSNAQRGYFAQADLGNGALKGRAFVNQSGPGAGNASVNPRYGDTITFNSPTADTWDFTFSIDGTVKTNGDAFPMFQTFPGGTFQTTFVNLALHIFEGNTVAAIGTNPGNGLVPWIDVIGNALFSEVISLDFDVDGQGDGNQVGDMLDNVNLLLNDSISGSLDLAAGMNSFDVVAVLAVSGSVPGNLVSGFDLDFSNTATLEINSAVPFTSESGVFLSGQNRTPIPEPGTAALLLFGALAMRRRRQPRGN